MYREILICISPAILLMSFSVYSASLWQCHGNRTSSFLKAFVCPHCNANPSFSHLSTSAIVFEKHRFQCRNSLFSLDGRTKRMNIDAFVDLPGLVWTGPQLEAYQGLEWAVQPFNTSENCSEKSKSFTYSNFFLF